MNDWEKLKELVAGCRRCDLCLERTNPVFGEGNPATDVMFVGEGPGKDEDIKGRPFVGAAGKILDEMLEMIGLNRADVFIGNVVKCRPPQNRDPRPEEIESCREYLTAQVAFIQPHVICTLGRHSLATLVNPNLKISVCHGRVVREKGLLFLPMYHPAAVLHNRSQDLKDKLIFDFEQLKALMERDFFN